MKSKIHASILGLVALGAALVSPMANALTITYNSVSPYGAVLWGNDNSTAAIVAAVGAYAPTVSELYKQNASDNSEDGSLASAYHSTFNSTSDASSGTVVWDGPAYVSGTPKYFLVKDGNQQPNWFLYDITGWDGKETITFTGFWPAQGSISHVSIWGASTSTNTPGVPDGGTTVALLGMGLAALGMVRRFTR